MNEVVPEVIEQALTCALLLVLYAALTNRSGDPTNVLDYAV